MAVDRLSSQWVSSWPGLDTPLQPALGDAEFGEVVTTYLVMESPALRGLAGRSIPCGHRRHTVCDAHGFQLGLATLPGAVHTLVHNGCSFELWRMMREAGVYCEVEPRHLFNTLLPAAYLLQPGPRPNIVPDARMHVALALLRTLEKGFNSGLRRNPHSISSFDCGLRGLRERRLLRAQSEPVSNTVAA